MKDIEFAVSELIDGYRNKYPRQKVIDALNAQAGLLVGDDGWTGETEEFDHAEGMPSDAQSDPVGEFAEASEPTDPTAA